MISIPYTSISSSMLSSYSRHELTPGRHGGLKVYEEVELEHFTPTCREESSAVPADDGAKGQG